jgi:hypothetical protein
VRREQAWCGIVVVAQLDEQALVDGPAEQALEVWVARLDRHRRRPSRRRPFGPVAVDRVVVSLGASRKLENVGTTGHPDPSFV